MFKSLSLLASLTTLARVPIRPMPARNSGDGVAGTLASVVSRSESDTTSSKNGARVSTSKDDDGVNGNWDDGERSTRLTFEREERRFLLGADADSTGPLGKSELVVEVGLWRRKDASEDVGLLLLSSGDNAPRAVELKTLWREGKELLRQAPVSARY